MEQDPMRRDAVAYFHAAFGYAPSHIVHAPGRVNLIGEHTDYNGLPVLPMAIQRAVTIAMRARNDGRVRLENVDRRFSARELEIAAELEPFARGDWGNYAKAAVAISCEHFGFTRGFDGVVAGDIPPAAGLSSSSALVVACALALATANEREVAREQMMALTARGERYVGVQSGGMDQAICLGGEVGHALVIHFDPLRLEPVRVPDDWRFVIADSLVAARKSTHARDAYNARVVECQEALRLVLADSRARAWPATYRELVDRVAVPALLDVAETALPDTLSRRFRHVVTEGARVESARVAMQSSDMATFGRLMEASHRSLADDYEVSCAELDLLVSIARTSGAVGARLTGAGFGGSIVALAHASAVEPILDALAFQFHTARAKEPRRHAFVATPSAGASVNALASQ